MPGWFRSLMTVPEQTIEPSGESKKTLPTGAACWWYGVFSAVASTGAGSGSLTPWSAAASFVETVLLASFADFIRSGFHRPLITGLTKSLASLSHLSLSQFFQPPLSHWSTSMPWSLSLSAMSAGTLILPSPVDPEPGTGGVGLVARLVVARVAGGGGQRQGGGEAGGGERGRRPRRDAEGVRVERMVR